VWNIHWSLRIVCSIVAGLISVRLFIIYHDFQHWAILKKAPLAKVLMSIFGAWILTPPSIWRRSHNYHHKHNAKIYGASIGSYPVMTVQDYAKATPKDRKRYLRARSTLTILLGYYSMFLKGMCYRSLKVNPRMHWDSAAILVFHVASIVGFAFAGWDILLLTLMLPLFIVHAMGAYLFYAQHNYPDVQLRSRQSWAFVFAATHSSSYMKMSKVMHWFTGNIGYHHVHHLNARIPFYRLPEAMAAIPELQNPGTTSWKLRDIGACLKLKLWDTETNRMVGLDGG
jgi:omega-6 fatty acid desaturase (delta-12 desaturase)